MRNKIICKLTLLLYVNWILILPKGGFQSDQALHHRYKKRGMIMYQTLWNSINHQVKKSHASAAFLAVSLIEWTTLGLLAGFFISIIGGMSAITKLTVILCAGGYTGLIFGFFGGEQIPAIPQQNLLPLLPPDSLLRVKQLPDLYQTAVLFFYKMDSRLIKTILHRCNTDPHTAKSQCICFQSNILLLNFFYHTLMFFIFFRIINTYQKNVSSILR